MELFIFSPEKMENKTKYTMDPKRVFLVKTNTDSTIKRAYSRLNPLIIPLIVNFKDSKPASANFLLQISITKHNRIVNYFVKDSPESGNTLLIDQPINTPIYDN